MMVPCSNYKCEHWDSDANGGHCMLASPKRSVGFVTTCLDYKKSEYFVKKENLSSPYGKKSLG